MKKYFKTKPTLNILQVKSAFWQMTLSTISNTSNAMICNLYIYKNSPKTWHVYLQTWCTINTTCNSGSPLVIAHTSVFWCVVWEVHHNPNTVPYYSIYCIQVLFISYSENHMRWDDVECCKPLIILTHIFALSQFPSEHVFRSKFLRSLWTDTNCNKNWFLEF